MFSWELATGLDKYFSSHILLRLAFAGEPSISDQNNNIVSLIPDVH